MDTALFLRTILPASGLKVLAELVPYKDKETGVTREGWRYLKFDDAFVMAQAALQLDERGKTVYHACNSYNDWYEETDKHGKKKRRIRTQANVVMCRSLYDDFDVSLDENKPVYRSREAAKEGVKTLASTLGIMPVITSSGGGFHVYFPLDEDITKEEWLRLSKKKRAVTKHLGLKVDRAVDLDCARVLRPIGTHNRKTDEPRPVKLISKTLVVSSVQKLEAALDAYLSTHDVTVGYDGPKEDTPGWAQDPAYPPSSAIKIVQHCNAVKQVADCKGDCEEPLWRAMLGLVKFTTEGDAQCHEWSTGYANYDSEETQQKLDHWSTGPTTCEHFDVLTDCAKSCSRSGKQKSPITLGYSDESPSEVTIPVAAPVAEAEAEDPHILVNNRKLYHFPRGYAWSNRFLCRSVADQDGVITNVPFALSMFYPITRIRDEEGAWSIRCASLEANGKWKEFNIPMIDTAAGDSLAKALAKYEVFIPPGKNTRSYAMSYMHDYILSLQQANKAVRTYKRFGWADEYESFIIGNTRIHSKGEEPILCVDIPHEVQNWFGVKGTSKQWAEDINFLVNRPGAELSQYAMCHAFGAVLVELVHDKQWHGVPMAIIGKGARGKTTIANLAVGAFGDASADSTSAGATIPAALTMISIMNGLPLLLDETSGRTPQELQEIAYSSTNGKHKIRLTREGNLRSGATPWFGSPFLTSNQSIHEQLSTLESGNISEATQVRVFEFEIDPNYIDKVYPDRPDIFIKKHLREQYGAAGREFISFALKNREWVHEQLVKMLNRLEAKSGDETVERFYRYDLAVSMVAGLIAQKLGLLRFDMKHLRDWVLAHIISIRSNRKNLTVNPSDYVAQFISDLHGRMIITKELRDGRSEGLEEPITPLRDSAVGRVSITEKRVILHAKAVTDWAVKRKLSPSVLKHEMDRLGLLIHHTGEGSSLRFRIGKGTSVMSSPAVCYELSYDKVMGHGKLELVRPALKSEDAVEVEK